MNELNKTSSIKKSIVLIGLMGAGKSSVGRRLSGYMGLQFVDADHEIEAAAGCTVSDIFKLYGEKAFRDGERKVIKRLLEDGPVILATGGGAFMDDETRQAIKEKGISVWLKADLEILISRTEGRPHRPLLQQGNPRDTLKWLMDERYPVYGQADIAVDAKNENPENTAQRVYDSIMESFTDD
ncbi:MAG: shikimate kinase [Alphaproteobacteria bacterium]|nr:shikimate kinase [Alphaproteobacteria bacterium]